MNYIVGDIGNTSTKICTLNKKFKIIKSLDFDTKKLLKKNYFKKFLNHLRIIMLIKNYYFQVLFRLPTKKLKKV